MTHWGSLWKNIKYNLHNKRHTNHKCFNTPEGDNNTVGPDTRRGRGKDSKDLETLITGDEFGKRDVSTVVLRVGDGEGDSLICEDMVEGLTVEDINANWIKWTWLNF